MKRLKSRNFILFICGIFIIFILSFTIGLNVVEMLEEIDDVDEEKIIFANVVSSSSKVKLSGKGNFITNAPNVSGTSIFNFNVKLSDVDDSVMYTNKFCNKNNEDVLYSDLIAGNIECSDDLGVKKDCSNIKVNGYVRDGNKVLKENDKIRANGCVDFILEVKYVGKENIKTIVWIDKYSLILKVS